MASSLTKDSASSAGGEKTFFGHPRGMATLFMTEMWERFSWYGMRGILVLYLIAGVLDGPLAGREALAASIYGVYNAVVYMAAMPGGWIADRLWGARKAVLVGGIVIALGHFTLAIPADVAFFCGLGLIAIGTGLLKPNISAMVGGLYEGGPAPAATPASRSSTWRSTSAAWPPRWSSATSARTSTGTSASVSPVSA
ncbi:hypothetical protein GCM10020295_50220 [Streptomyces cinereospinus]